jgi:hypothetical protein
MRHILAALLLSTAAAYAQPQLPVQQSGVVTPGHGVMWTTTGVIQDAGTAAAGSLSGIGVTGSGPTICANSAPTTGAYNQVCIGAVTNTGAIIYSTANGGATGNGVLETGNPTFFTDTADVWTSSQFRVGAVLSTQNVFQATTYIQTSTPNTNATTGTQKDALAVYYESSDQVNPLVNLGSGAVAIDSRGIVSASTPYGNAWAADYIPGIVYEPVGAVVAAPGTGYCRVTMTTAFQPNPAVLLNGASVLAHDIGGATGCSGTFVAARVGSSLTQIDLVGSVFGGAYTSGGAIGGDGYITGLEVDVYNGGLATANINGISAVAVTNVTNNGSGNCRITVGSSTFTAANNFTTNGWVSLGGILGATGCNGTFQITVNSATQADLQNSVFGGTYTSGGGIVTARPKIAFQAVATGLNNSSAGFMIYSLGGPNFTYGYAANQNAIGTYFAVLYSGSGSNVTTAPLFYVDVNGNASAVSYLVGSTAGVNCSGSPTGSFASVKGIVTHC